MVERTLLWKLGALAPVGTMLCFVVQHQFLKDSFNPISIDGRVDSRIDAYVPIVREIEQANFEKKSNFAKAEQLASKWADQSRQKVFEPLLPCVYGDDFDDGPRSQVLAASISLVDELARYSISEAQSRKYIHAVKLIETAMDQLEDLKYSDITALRLTITKQTRLLGTLRWIDAKANHSFSDVVKAERSKFEIQPDKLESLARHMKSLYVQAGHSSNRQKGCNSCRSSVNRATRKLRWNPRISHKTPFVSGGISTPLDKRLGAKCDRPWSRFLPGSIA